MPRTRPAQPPPPPPTANPPAEAELDFARGVIRAEADALDTLADQLDSRFTLAVDLLARCPDAGGAVLVTGLGKSGLIGAKIAATLSSLGIPSHPVHPTEAAHGDLGRFRPADTVIALSRSGETDEVVNLAAVLRQDGIPIISITGGDGRDPDRPRSSLERLATVALTLGDGDEAGPVSAPTSSTAATLALGDALALAAARRRNFTDADFAKRHPGGALGGLLRPITELLRFRAGVNTPLIPHDRSVADALREASRAGRRPGAILLVDPASGRLSGIFTDGDLRRLILRDAAELARPISEVMTRSPRSLPHDALLRDAVRMVREHRQDEIPVVDGEGRPVGLLDVQDLVAMRLVRNDP
ncbi:MAG: KpsF/GutQ family sugar-phosphate isomerase [Phycisphaerales bacterium]|nr:KpsF/GutQ family sugar-phosphate isomerase [Phycisphaerales bacterium]